MGKFLWVGIAGAVLASSAQADYKLLDSLSGTWESFDAFVTVGQCHAFALDTGSFCGPHQLATLKGPRNEVMGFVSATDSVLNIVDSIKKTEASYGQLQELFSKYNYTEALVAFDMRVMHKNIYVGVRPIAYKGQFQIHNPNLPLASLTFRDDIAFLLGYSNHIKMGDFKLNLGAMAEYLNRKETLAEATVLDFATTAPKDLLKTEKYKGMFFDVGGSLVYDGFFTVATLAKNLGGYWEGKRDRSGNYLYIQYDKSPRMFHAMNVAPKVFGGKLYLGVQTIQFLQKKNDLGKQTFGTISYIIGPLRIVSGLHPRLLRTGLGLNFSGFEAGVAQEWKNEIEDGRRSQPRFTLSLGASL